MNTLIRSATEAAVQRPAGQVSFGRSGLAGAVASEWTKLCTVRSIWFNLAGAVVLMALLGMQFGFNTAYETSHLEPGAAVTTLPVGEAAINAALVVQVVVTAIAMLTITAEYATGSIRSTLQWTPVRRNVVLAKVVVVTPVVFLLGVVLAVIGAVTGGLAAGRWAVVDLSDAAVDVIAIAGYLAMASLVTLGLGLIIRSTAGTLTASFLLLLVLPMMLGASGFTLTAWIAALLPGGAGQNFLTGSTDPLPPSASFAVLIAWAAGALSLGSRALQRRDA